MGTGEQRRSRRRCWRKGCRRDQSTASPSANKRPISGSTCSPEIRGVRGRWWNMSDHPRVSVIIPVYNDEANLGEAVESVMGQTFTSWEVLVVDDDSTDGTPALAASLAARDSRVRVLHPGRNVGAPAARDFALRHARGELIALLDSDDYFLPGYLERCVTLFDEAADAGRRPGIVASNC